MRARTGLVIALALLVALAGACGGDGGDDGAASEGGGDERTVLVDYKHDQFASAFLAYYPHRLKVHAGDTVRFKQSWTGEPHSVTAGGVVDAMMTVGARFEKYDSEEEALAGGETPESIAEFLGSAAKVPGMVAYEGYEIYQPGARPCFVADADDVPAWSDPATEQIDPDAECPAGGDRQPAFDGRQALYNSGFIPPEGPDANTFVVPIAADAEPGTYQYFCNYHWTGMKGAIEIVPDDEPVPGQAEVSRQARKEIDADAKAALAKVEQAKRLAPGRSVDGLELPLAGRDPGEDSGYVIVNEFLPGKFSAKVGQKVTWTFDGNAHTVSFNVPKYFPLFTVRKDGDVVWNAKSHEAVGWTVPERADDGIDGAEEPPPRDDDVGTWDGRGGLHS
jgi:plastocyanin